MKISQEFYNNSLKKLIPSQFWGLEIRFDVSVTEGSIELQKNEHQV